MGEHHAPWDHQVLQGVADVLGGGDTGLTGTEIGSLLAGLELGDSGPGITKRFRLGEALLARQATLREDALNEVLVFEGLRVRTTASSPAGYAPAPSAKPTSTPTACAPNYATVDPP